MIIKLLFLTSLFISMHLSAHVDLCHPLTLAELINIALENNPSTRQAWWNAQRAASYLGNAQSASYPQLDLNLNTRHGRTFKFVNGPDTNYTVSSAELSLSYLLLDFGERQASIEAAKMGLQAANWQTDATLQQVIVNVLENAYSTIHSIEVFQAALISSDDAEKLLHIAKELYEVGLNSLSDIYTSEAALAQMKMEVIQQKTLLDIQKNKLAVSLGISPEIPLQLAPFNPPPNVANVSTSELITLAKQQRADLLAKRANLSESYAKLERARTAYYPKVTLSSYGGAERAFRDKAHGAHYQVAFNIDIPLFNGFASMYEKGIAYANARLSAEELAKVELDIALEVLTYSKLVESTQEMLEYANSNLQNSQLAYEGILDKYKAGTERMSETSSALRQLLAARVRYSDIKTRQMIALANLAYATGILTPYMEDSCDKLP